jgi:four helix bundle protein
MADGSRVPPYDILERTIAYSLQTIHFCRGLENDPVNRILSRQLLRSATSVGANVHEAQGGQSRADFISKMSIAHKEAREAAYWLRLLREDRIGNQETLNSLIDETRQLMKILASIILNTKEQTVQYASTASSKSAKVFEGYPFLLS